ncbi:DUF6520 family protein [Salegentibacter sp. HM20]
MKTRNLILPLLAFVFAVGMSFATVGVEADPNNDYIQRNGAWEAIPEQDCGTGQITCEVQKSGEGTFTVYDSQNLSSMKTGDGRPLVIQ